MNREIEFRAWDKKRKKMVDVSAIYIANEQIGYEVKEIFGNYAANYIQYIYLDQCELMQYTGLKDKNGVKIFEGDIIKDDRERIFVIEYEFGGFNVVPIDYYNDELFSWNSLGDMQTAIWLNESTEIIGNIYKNKELLEDE